MSLALGCPETNCRLRTFPSPPLNEDTHPDDEKPHCCKDAKEFLPLFIFWVLQCKFNVILREIIPQLIGNYKGLCLVC